MKKRYRYIFWLVLLFGFVVLFLSKEKRNSESLDVKPLTCTDMDTEAVLVRPCIVERIDSLSLEALHSVLHHLSPRSFQSIATRGGYTQDWIPLVLYPFVEAAVVQKCEQFPLHAYCDTSKRQRLHRHIENRLNTMLQSKNEMLQYHGLLLACARAEAGYRHQRKAMKDARSNGYMDAVSLCAEETRAQLRSTVFTGSGDIFLLSLLKYARKNTALLDSQHRREGDRLTNSFWFALDQLRQE